MTEPLSPAEQEIHAAARQWSGIAVLMLALLAIAPMWEELRAILRVGPLDTIPTLGSGALMMSAAQVAVSSRHVNRRWYRVIDLVETAGGQAAFLYLIYTSRYAVSFFWTLHFSHILFVSTSPNLRRINTLILGMGPAALAVAFIRQGDLGSGIFCLWAAGLGIVEFWMLDGLKHRLARRMEKLKQAEAKTTLAVERQRIARDLHDGVGAELAALLWQMRQLDLELAGAAHQQRVSGLVDHAHRSLVELHSIVWAMRAPTRPWPEMVERLRHFLAQLCANRMTLEFSASRAGGEVPGNICQHLERFVQEAAQNALKHARATRLRVELTYGSSLCASVEDDGVGLPPDVVALSEGGLRNLRERLGSIGGELAIRPCSPGTRLSASFPLHELGQSQAV